MDESEDVMQRPSHHDPAIVAAACEALLSDVMQHINAPDDDRDDVLSDLIRCADDDGYAFASNLDRNCYWNCDFALAEILDGYSTYGAHKDAVRQWVKYSGIEVAFAIGDRVIARGDECQIVRIDADTAEVVAQPIGDERFARGGGYIVPVEKIALADDDPAMLEGGQGI